MPAQYAATTLMLLLQLLLVALPCCVLSVSNNSNAPTGGVLKTVGAHQLLILAAMPSNTAALAPVANVQSAQQCRFVDCSAAVAAPLDERYCCYCYC
jgi:hypothetical protein